MRGLKRFAILLICLPVCVTICFGQKNPKTKPDFSGTWEFDRKRSNVGNSNSSSPPEQITISHHDPELKIRKKVTINGQLEERELTYYADGRGETNPTTAWITTRPGSSDRPLETSSKTTWSGDRLVTRAMFQQRITGGVMIEFEIRVERRLSSDGQTLTETTHTTARPDVFSGSVLVGGRGNDFKAVYKLVSK